MLEHKIPPPLIALLIGAAMWFGARSSPQVQVEPAVRAAIALVFLAVGFLVALAGVVAFKRAKTTLNPSKPETASSLVVAGVYRYTRNPMYLGLAVALLGWAVYLAAPLALLGPVFLVWFVTRFQIVPEERALVQIFGNKFVEYQEKVGRWF